MTWLGRVGLLWGLGGTALLVLEPIARLSLQAAAAFTDPALTGWHLAFGAGWTGAMAHFEGYRAFQRGFSPRIVVRAWHLARAPSVGWVLLAPAFCIGLVHATRRRLLTSWLVVVLVRVLIEVVRHLEQPLRGMVDAGVVVGLAWGLVAMLLFAARAALTGALPHIAADLPSVEGRLK